jgi:hypothetical protein
LERLENCSEERIEELRAIAWEVVYKYAKMLYTLDFGVVKDEYLD